MKGLPTVRVDDLLVHPRDNDLIVGTHGRSIWIIDDITALQQMTPSHDAGGRARCSTCGPATAWLTTCRRRSRSEGAKHFRGQNPGARHRDQLLAEGRARG